MWGQIWGKGVRSFHRGGLRKDGSLWGPPRLREGLDLVASGARASVKGRTVQRWVLGLGLRECYSWGPGAYKGLGWG